MPASTRDFPFRRIPLPWAAMSAKANSDADHCPKSSCSPTARCSGNPGPGRLGLHPPASGHRARSWKSSGGEPETTNNRMELTAVVRGLEALKKPSHVKLHDRQRLRRQGAESSGCPSGRPTAGGAARARSGKRSRTKTSGAQLDELIARHKLDLHPRRRPQRPPRERPLRRTGRGGVSAVSEADSDCRARSPRCRCVAWRAVE